MSSPTRSVSKKPFGSPSLKAKGRMPFAEAFLKLTGKFREGQTPVKKNEKKTDMKGGTRRKKRSTATRRFRKY